MSSNYDKRIRKVGESKVIDSELLQGYVDNLGVEVVQQMLDLYRQQSAVYIEEIGEALSNESQEEWQERCHKMKGAAGSVGLLSVHSKLVAIEKSTDSWSSKQIFLQELSDENQSSIDIFEQWLA